MNTTAKILGGFVAGAAIGTLTGILIAPKSGQKIRSDIKGKFNELKDIYNDKVDEYAKNGKHSLDSLKEKVKV
jgi:gas vesicle protein